MRAIWITKHGGPEVLQVRESADPTPKAGEVRVRVKAAGLNFAEVMARQGMYPDAPKPPCVVGYEAAGVVDFVGEGVSEPLVGTRVLVLSMFGAHADTVCVPARQAIPMPDGMSFEEGAALPVVYVTAFHMLFRVANVRKGERVLIHMAAGGVGTAALQLCRTIEGVVTFGTASASKHEFLRSEGCTHPIDYRTKDYAEEIKRLTSGQGVDVVLDPLGGRDWKKGLELLRPVGRLVAFGFANMSSGEKRSYFHMAKEAIGIPLFSPLGLMDANKTIAGVNMGHLWHETELLREEIEALLALYGAGKIKPHIDAVLPFDKAGEAHQRLTSRKNVGKVVLVPLSFGRMPSAIERWVEAYLGVSPELFGRAVGTVVVLVSYALLRRLSRRVITRFVDEPDARYQVVNATAYVLGIVGVLLLAKIWFAGLTGLATYLGLLSAGLAVALQEPLVNLAGWLFILARRPFKVGDRVQVGPHAGDVVDVRIFRFLMLEIGNWVDADQSTGRVLHVPNGWIFKHSIANYDGGFGYIWNEIEVVVTFESDWRAAKEILTRVINDRAEHLTEDAVRRIDEAAEHFHMKFSKLTPVVWTSAVDMGVKLTMRYLCKPRERRSSASEIWESVLDEFAKREDVDLAYPTTRWFDQAREGKTSTSSGALSVRPPAVSGDVERGRGRNAE